MLWSLCHRAWENNVDNQWYDILNSHMQLIVLQPIVSHLTKHRNCRILDLALVRLRLILIFLVVCSLGMSKNIHWMFWFFAQTSLGNLDRWKSYSSYLQRKVSSIMKPHMAEPWKYFSNISHVDLNIWHDKSWLICVKVWGFSKVCHSKINIFDPSPHAILFPPCHTLSFFVLTTISLCHTTKSDLQLITLDQFYILYLPRIL